MKIQISLSAVVPGGVYSSVEPDDNSRALLRGILRHVRHIDPVKSSSMHVTVVYSKNDNAVTEVPDTSQTEFWASIKEFTTWVGHNGLPYLVALLDSPDLEEAYQSWIDMGYTADFPTYRPHITIKKDFVHTRPIEVVTLLNNLLKVSRSRLVFGSQNIKSLDA